MSAWVEGSQEENINDIDKSFEDNFVSPESENDFHKLEDSDDYLKLLGKYLSSCCHKLDWIISNFHHRIPPEEDQEGSIGFTTAERETRRVFQQSSQQFIFNHNRARFWTRRGRKTERNPPPFDSCSGPNGWWNRSPHQARSVGPAKARKRRQLWRASWQRQQQLKGTRCRTQ